MNWNEFNLNLFINISGQIHVCVCLVPKNSSRDIIYFFEFLSHGLYIGESHMVKGTVVAVDKVRLLGVIVGEWLHYHNEFDIIQKHRKSKTKANDAELWFFLWSGPE